jgi:GT2 family glycosyltransferase
MIRTIFDEPHHQSLELLATQALAKNEIAVAFKLADRRCRILPLPEPHSFILRAEACQRRGDRAAAISDLARALEIDPGDMAANRRMLAWADGTKQIEAARVIIDQDRNIETLRKAVAVLHKNGQRSFARVSVFEDAIEGWAIWQGEPSLKVTILDGSEVVTESFAPNSCHPLAAYGSATEFQLLRPKSENSQTIELALAGSVLYSTRTQGNDGPPIKQISRSRPRVSPSQPVTVIVPVHGDYDATRMCIEALRDELRSCNYTALLVNDATPDKRIAQYLADVATDSCFELIVNTRNLGFVGSVNCALGLVEAGDVILLNSDTIVPRGFINRLAAAARSSADIGTVTPLSNNAEFLSFPIPNQANRLGSRQEIERINAIAADTNSDSVVDIPSGIGFCLYITRPCLDRVGSLSQHYSRGYLEDADFCLRAREHGFRNVCAPSVYVGHAGAKSFGQDKRSLVVRNLRILEQRFPKHRSECAAFMAVDPLCAARQAIEREAAHINGRCTLLVTGAGVMNATAHQRAREVGAATEPVLILQVHFRTHSAVVELKSAGGEMPQSLQFDLSLTQDRQSLSNFLKRIAPSRIEFLDPANTPFRLTKLLSGLNIAYGLYIADAGLLGRHNEDSFVSAIRCIDSCKSNRPRQIRERDATGRAGWISRWREIAEGAHDIVVPSPEAETFAISVLPRSIGNKIDRAYKKRQPGTRKLNQAKGCHLGLVPVRSCAQEQRLMAEIARRLGRIRSDMSITVVGAALDDIDLMQRSNAFVTGMVRAEEFDRLAEVLDINNLFISTTRPIFAHPILSATTGTGLPTAYFDWSAGRLEPKAEDLPIRPGASLDDLVASLNRWMPRS